MMIGLDNSSQIANTVFRQKELINSLCVKPVMNENSRRLVEEKVEKLVDTTDIFVVFGMSIGQTDAKWWKQVVQRLCSEGNTFLLVIDYDKNFNPALPYTSSLISKRILNNLLTISECPEECQDTLRGKVDILLNTDLFRFSSLLPAKNERENAASQEPIGVC